MQHLRRITDRIAETGASAAEQAGRTVSQVGERSNEAARSAYRYVMNHPKATTAVVLGTGVAAALLWMVQRSGGYSSVRRKVLERVRSGESRMRSGEAQVRSAERSAQEIAPTE